MKSLFIFLGFVYFFLLKNAFGMPLFQDYMIDYASQNYFPKKGSIQGAFSTIGPSSLSNSSGSFSFVLPIDWPNKRGKNPFPLQITYSPSNGLSNFGLGFNHNLSVTRYRKKGLINFKDDSLMTIFGRLDIGKDGDYFLIGPDTKIRAKIDSESNLTIFLQNGMKLFYLNTDAIRHVNGEIFEWKLSLAISNNLNQAKYIYDKDSQLLKNILYGGHKSSYQYNVLFDYEEREIPLTDWSLGRKKNLNKRVKSMAFELIKNDNNLELYKYKFKYINQNLSPSFYLNSVTKVFPSGSDEPIIFEYAEAEKYLDKVKFEPSKVLNKLIGKYSKHILTNSNSTLYDFNENGEKSLEIRRSYKRIHISDGTIKEEIIVNKSNMHNHCIPNDYFSRNIRSFFRPFGPDTESLAFRLHDYENESYILICNADGSFFQRVFLNSIYKIGIDSVFMDANKDGLPDLVRVVGHSLEIRINRSKDGVVKFAAPIRKYLVKPVYSSYGLWSMDINGDGELDLISKQKYGLLILHGDKTKNFESRNQSFMTLYKTEGSDISALSKLSEFQFYFTDLNKDSLIDIIISNSSYIATFYNIGSSFLQRKIRPLILPYNVVPFVRIGDIEGVGSPQIVKISENNKGEYVAYKMNLTPAGTGLIKSIDDGKGTLITANYKISKAEKGMKQKISLLSKLTVDTVGEGKKEWKYKYAKPSFLEETGRFIGFRDITKSSLIDSTKSRYHYLDGRSLNQATSITDKKEKGLTTINEQSFVSISRDDSETKTFEIRNLLKTQKIEGLSHIITSRNTKFDSNGCPLVSEKLLRNEKLITKYVYETPPLLADHITCLPSRVTREDHGKYNSEIQFEITYDKLGRKERLDIIKDDNKSLVQKINYQKGRITSVIAAGEGELLTLFDKKFRLVEEISPDGSKVKINKYDLHDNILVLDKTYGSKAFKEYFSYDGLQRLKKYWIEGDIYTESKPLTTYNYKYSSYKNMTPGVTKETISIEVNDKLINTMGSHLFSGKGQLIGKVNKGIDGRYISKLKKSDSSTNRKTIFNQIIFNEDIADLNIDQLYTNKTINSLYEKNLQGDQSLRVSALHHNVEHRSRTFSHIQNNKILKVYSEGCISFEDCISGPYVEKEFDLSGNLLVFKNQNNEYTKYKYDLLNRLRQVDLPNNNQVKLSYRNEFGKVSKIERTNFGEIDYKYNQAGKISKKLFHSNKKKLSRTEAYDYDNSGRVIKKLTADVRSGNERTTSYEYDNKLLRRVSNNQFNLLKGYRKDGKLKKESLNIFGIGKITNEYKYFHHGKAKSIVYKSLMNGKALSSKISYKLNNFGKVNKILLNNNIIVTIEYDKFNRPLLISTMNRSEKINYDLVSEKMVGKTITAGLKQTSYAFSFNERGLINREEYLSSKSSIKKNFTYNENGYLEELFEVNNLNQDFKKYGYDENGIMNSFVNAKQVKVPFKLQADKWSLGKKVYLLDDQGRVIEKEGRKFQYGPSGRIETVKYKGDQVKLIYDHKNILIGKVASKLLELTYNGSMIINGELYIPIKVENNLIGHIKNNKFIPNITDYRGTIINSSNKALSTASPYGERKNNLMENRVFLDYANKGYDRHVGAIKMGARYYDPLVKRFLTPDPLFMESPRHCIKSPVECNLYSYARNNPLNFVDPSGYAVEVLSRHVALNQRHLLINVTPADNYVEAPRILSLIGPSGTSGIMKGGIASLPFNGNKYDKGAVFGGAAKQSQIIEMPSFYRSQKDFQDNLIDMASRYDLHAPENKYPSFGGLFESDARNSNTYVDDMIEGSGGTIMDFDNTPLQNSGE